MLATVLSSQLGHDGVMSIPSHTVDGVVESILTVMLLNRALLKDQRRRSEGGEWEPIKIPQWNFAYVPN
jgi:hypothetical protein